MRALNLLQYPSLARQQKVFHRWWSGLAGVFLGSSLAWGWQQWQELETVRLQQAHSQLQAAWATRSQLAQEAGRQQTRWRLQTAQINQLKQIAQHQQAWASLHDTLQKEAQDRGLRLARLQSEAEKIEWHGTMARFDAMSDARQSLSDQLAQAVVLTSSTVGPRDEVSFVWQAVWPVAPGTSLAAATRPSPSKP